MYAFILPVGILMFMLDKVAKPLPHEKYPLVTYKTVTTCQLHKHMRKMKKRTFSLDSKYVTKINLCLIDVVRYAYKQKKP